MKNEKNAEDLLDFLYDSPSPYHAVENCKTALSDAGFKFLNLSESWKIKRGEGYFVSQNDSTLIAFYIGSKCDKPKFKIAGAHTDSPSLKIKPNPELLSEGYLRLNVEVYGGPILSTWFDRPLCIAGRVLIKGKDVFSPECLLVNMDKPIIIIPNLAIHMNREVNKGVEINNQKVLLPILQTIENKFETKDYLLKLISKELKVKESDILDFDLNLYEYDKGRLVGVDKEFISSSRIDNLEGVFSGISALVRADHQRDSICVMACFDNEEVGSSTKQGANSQLLTHILERIVINLGSSSPREDFLKSIPQSFMISIDGAHSIHPNYTEKSDPVNKPVINRGPVIKISANQKYTSDAQSVSVLKNIAEKADISYQEFVNHSNEKGGSTIGPISSTHLEIRSVDIGVPMLAMHSIREMCGLKDHLDMIKLITKFYEL